jgi:hypothetical protein
MKTKAKLLFLAFLVFTTTIQAQVTIGSGIEPHKDALLDLKEKENGTSLKGMLLPRVSLEATDNRSPMSETDLTLLKGMTVYNLATGGTGATTVTPGIYYHDGTKWVRMGQQWFYMPTVEFDASSKGSTHAVDLYALYEEQFTDVQVRNVSAPKNIPTLKREELNYYITYYDDDIFDQMAITEGGELSYTVKNEAIVPTYVTVVFVAK